MTSTGRFELPPDKERVLRKAIRLEWLTLGYLLSAIVFIYLTLGSSQAMKTAWFEDMLSLIPPIAFLVATKIRHRRPTSRFPYGFHRAVSIAFLCAALALFSMGAFLLWDSVMKLISFEHPSIGVVQPFGDPIWLGWLMIPALLWSAIPAVLIGRAKISLARELHDKVLYADSEMNKADWMTATAAIAGVLGIGLGLWWADAAAATFISLDILHDGWKNLRAVISDLMDSRPTSVDHERIDPLPATLQTHLESLEWIARARVRLREEGHVYYGEAFIELADERDVVGKVARTADSATELDWRLHDVVVMPVRDVDELPEPEDVEEGIEQSGAADRA